MIAAFGQKCESQRARDRRSLDEPHRDAIAQRIVGVTGPDAELVELVWMPLKDAKQLDMPAVTGVMLEELDARIAEGFGHDLPVPFYQMPRGRFMRELL